MFPSYDRMIVTLSFFKPNSIYAKVFLLLAIHLLRVYHDFVNVEALKCRVCKKYYSSP